MKKYCFLYFNIILTTVFICSSSTAYAYNRDVLLANFLFNLLDYVKWNKETVNICTYGQDNISYNLKKLSHSNLNNNKRLSRLYDFKDVNIMENVDLTETPNCNLLYISENKAQDASQVIQTVAKHPVLTVSTIQNFVNSGGILELKVTRRKVRVTLGQDALAMSNIGLSPIIIASTPTHIQDNTTFTKNTAIEKGQ